MIALWSAKAAITKLCFIPSSRVLAAGDENGTVVGWNLDTGTAAFTWETGGTFTFALAASADGARVYAATGGVSVYDNNAGTSESYPDASNFALNTANTRRIDVWHDQRKKTNHLRCWKLHKKSLPLLDWTGPPNEFMYFHPVFFPDGKRFAVYEELARPKAIAAGADLLICDAAKGTIRVRVPADDLSVEGTLLVQPDETRLVGVMRSKLVVWDSATGVRLTEPANPDGKRQFTGAAFHPSGRWLATSCNDATVRVWDTATWRTHRVFTWKVGKVKSIAYSADGLLAAAGGDKGQIVVWDVDE